VRQGARVLESGPEWTTVEFTSDDTTVGEFVESLRRHGNLDVARSGPVVMRRTA